eukprot:1293335-Amphidinium_carterae.1
MDGYDDTNALPAIVKIDLQRRDMVLSVRDFYHLEEGGPDIRPSLCEVYNIFEMCWNRFLTCLDRHLKIVSRRLNLRAGRFMNLSHNACTFIPPAGVQLSIRCTMTTIDDSWACCGCAAEHTQCGVEQQHWKHSWVVTNGMRLELIAVDPRKAKLYSGLLPEQKCFVADGLSGNF